ncbi:MAG TPA: circularly permuted type 2 ATP-grasp protein [Polyangiaceae bacterium]|nr:circularly permuted type 2 ATP-grasp protein [Polyangiaceae bacterium]
MQFETYEVGSYYDEMFEPGGRPRASAELLARRLLQLSDDDLARRRLAAERALLHRGITFNVYGGKEGREKIFPFDIVPRIVTAAEWRAIERGLVQRVRALNHFVDDVYHGGRIVAAGVVPEAVVRSAKGFLEPCRGFRPPRGVYCHVVGTDLVRDRDGQFYVLEDNLRCPSGVSYVLENRQVMKRTLPAVFEASRVRPVDVYPGRLRRALEDVSPRPRDGSTIVLLTPGVYNSAYFEHSFLAQQMGIELVEGRDLVVRDHTVYMRTTRGLKRVDVIYRRVDDTFLDPRAFRPDSLLGVPGLMDAYRRGRVALANAPGTGVADDKVVYAYVPKMIEYYLGEAPLLPNVPTFLCVDERQRAHVLANLAAMVVKPANESGGYGMLIGPHASPDERAAFAAKIEADPRNYVAQPMLSLSRVPTFVDGRLEGRHVDLRPYVLSGEDVFVLPGGLTRVALQRGSTVVNSSQGGGSKDTWVLSEDPAGARC